MSINAGQVLKFSKEEERGDKGYFYRVVDLMSLLGTFRTKPAGMRLASPAVCLTVASDGAVSSICNLLNPCGWREDRGTKGSQCTGQLEQN
jgi:hypothetical protein